MSETTRNRNDIQTFLTTVARVYKDRGTREEAAALLGVKPMSVYIRTTTINKGLEAKGSIRRVPMLPVAGRSGEVDLDSLLDSLFEGDMEG